MDLRRIFSFIIFIALCFTFGTFLGFFWSVPKYPIYAQNQHAFRQLDIQQRDVQDVGIIPENIAFRNGIDQPELFGERLNQSLIFEHQPKQNIVTSIFDPIVPKSRVKNKPKLSNKLHQTRLVQQDLTVRDGDGKNLGLKGSSKHSNNISIPQVPLKSSNKPSNKPMYHRETFTLPDIVLTEHVEVFSPTVKCLREGTNTKKTALKSNKECVCHRNWHGISCSVPDIVSKSSYPQQYGVMLAVQPRRIIYAMPFSHEFQLLEAKVHELYSIVDVFLILESNWTAAGKAKERFLMDKLNAGFLHQFQDKIVYISLETFPEKAHIDGWTADALLRDHIGKTGMKVLKGIRDEDVVVVNDADEIPMREAMIFLKFNTGYPEPVGFKLNHNIFGFFWRGKGESRTSEVWGAVSFSVLRTVYKNSFYAVRSASKNAPRGQALEKALRDSRVRIQSWSFGTESMPAGWHCSWCFDPEGVRMKLHFAHVSDEPRYGQIEGKDSLKYIQHLIKNGLWFDDKTKFEEVKDTVSEQYAPKYMRDNWNSFLNLLYLQS